MMAGGPEDHFTDSRELYVLVEGDEWAHVEALDPDAGYWGPPVCNSSTGGHGARLRAEGALTESEFEAVKARLLSDEASA